MPEAALLRRLIVVVGPSGAGKDSVLHTWLAGLPPQEAPHRVRRTITRPADAGGEAHEAVDDAGFEALRAAGEFAFDWQAHGLRYGVRWRELQPLTEGRGVVMNGSRQHLPELLRKVPTAGIVEVTASPEVRAARLALRGREDAQHQQERVTRDAAPVTAAALTIHNDGPLEQAVACLNAWWRGR